MKLGMHLDFAGLQALNMVIQPIATDPSSPSQAQIWFNTTSKAFKYHDGTSVQTLGNAGSGGPPSGAAGGDLNGSTYPNPVIAAGVVTGGAGGKIAGATIDNSNIAAGAAIAKSKLGALGIVDADVTGPIAHAKIAAPTAAYDFGGQRLTNLGTPTAASDGTTKAYVDGLIQGLNAHSSVIAASTGTNVNIAAPGTTLDGVALAAGNRILLKDQTTTSQNGIWVWNASGTALTRPTDFATGANEAGAFVFVEAGGTNANSGWVLSGAGPITVDTTAQTWVQFSGAGEITAGAGLSKTGNTLSVSGVTSAMITDGTIVNVDINAGAAIARSKLDFGTGLVDADIAAGAAIAVSKISGAARPFTTTIGDGAATTFVITHNLGRQTVPLGCRRVSDNAKVEPDATYTSATQTTLVFGTAPPANGMEVTLVG